MDAFFAALAEVHPLVADVAKVGLAALVVLAVWLIVSLPFYLLSRGGAPAFAAGRQWFDGLLLSTAAGRIRAFEALAVPLRDFVAGNKMKFVFDDAERALQLRLSEMSAVLGSLKDTLLAKNDKNRDACNDLDRSIKRFSSHGIGKTTINIPAGATVLAEAGVRRRAIAKLVTGIVFGAALISINTFLLSEFFDSFISLRVMGFKVSMLLAMFFSFIELAAGVWLYVTQETVKSGKSSIRSNIAELFLIAAILGLAAIEGWFYLLLSSQMDMSVINDLFAPDPAPAIARYWLVVIGPVVTFLLSFSGHVAFSGFNDLSTNAAAKDFERHLEEVRAMADSINDGFENARGKADMLKTSLAGLSTELQGQAETLGALPTVLSTNFASFESAIQAAANGRREIYGVMDDEEIQSLFRKQIFFAFGCLVVISVFIWSQAVFLDRIALFGANMMPLHVAFATAEAVAVLIASYAMTPRVRVLVDRSPPAVIPTEYFPGSRFLGLAAVGALILTNLFLTVRQSTAAEWLWFFFLVGCILLLVIVGRSLPVTVAAGWTGLRWVAKSLYAVTVALVSALLFALRGALGLLEALIAIAAYPFALLMKWFSKDRPVSSQLARPEVVQNAAE